MRRIQEFEAAELHEGDVAAGQFDSRAVRCDGMRETGLPDASVAMPRLAVLKHAFDNVANLIRLIAHADEPRPLASRAVGPEILGEALACKTDDAHSPPPELAASSDSSDRA